MRKTKLVCTIGPSCAEEQVLKNMIRAGMDVARINLSHGNRGVHEKYISMFKPLLLDTRGPEIRIKSIVEGAVQLQQGQEFYLTTQDVRGNEKEVAVSYPEITKDVNPGNVILLDDGNISLKVIEVTTEKLRCHVTDGGLLKEYKGVSIPGVHINLPIFSSQDREDIHFGLEQGIDFIALSFVRSREDVLHARNLLEDNEKDAVKLLAKIENQQGVDNFSSILEASDGILIARGDLGVEVPTEEVPLIQKSIIKECNREGKPVITATQMLESMIEHPRPTRAEASDVANAIFDGSDALMLSGETAVGKYPVEATETMSRIASRAEKNLLKEKRLKQYDPNMKKTVTDAISYATCHTAQELGASAIITSTQSGYTARMVSKCRPQTPIVAVTPVEKVAQTLTVSWGVYPIFSSHVENTDEMFEVVAKAALKSELINMGDLVVITAGLPVGVSGTTNFLRIETIGEIKAWGTGVGKDSVIGKAKVIKKEEDLHQVKEGDIAIVVSTLKNYTPYLHKVKGIVAEEGGLTSPSAILALEFKIPAIVGVESATDLVTNGELITLDSYRGCLYKGRATIM